MDVIAAYREVGSYRGAAAMCGTTHKTVKRIWRRTRPAAAPARTAAGPQLRRGAPSWSRSRWRRPQGGSRRSGCCRRRGRPAMPGRRATSAGWSPSGRRVAPRPHRGRRPGVWSPGDTLVIDWGVRHGLHVFCAVLAWSRLRFVRFAADEKAGTTLGVAGGVLRGARRGAEVGAGRPDGLSEGRGGRQRGGADRGLRPLRHPLPVPAGLLRGQRPGVEGHRGEPGRLRQVAT